MLWTYNQWNYWHIILISRIITSDKMCFEIILLQFLLLYKLKLKAERLIFRMTVNYDTFQKYIYIHNFH